MSVARHGRTELIHRLIRMKRLISYTLLLFLITSCAGSPNQHLVSEFEDRTFQSSISLVMIELEPLFDRFPDHSFGAFRPEERDHVEGRLDQILSETTTATIRGFDLDLDQEKVPFERRELEVRNGPFNMILPEEGTLLGSQNRGSRFVIILDQYRFEPYEQIIRGDSYAGHEGEVQHRMRFETKYAIWDNQNGEAIAWGTIDTNHLHLSTNRPLMYDNLLLQAMRKIIEVSPFPEREGPQL